MVIKNFYDLVMINKSSFVKIMRACDHLPELGKGQKILMAGGHQNAGPGKIFHDFITNENFLFFPFLYPPLLLQENIKLPLIVRVHFDFIKTPQHKKLEVFLVLSIGLVQSFEAFQKTFLPRTKSTSV